MFPNDPFITDFLFAKNSNRSDVLPPCSEGQRRCKICRENHFQRVNTRFNIHSLKKKKELNILLFDRQPNQNRQVQSFCLWRTHTRSLTNTLTYRFSTCLGPSWGLPACIAIGDWQRVSTRGEVRQRLSELTLHESLKVFVSISLRQWFLAVTPPLPPTFVNRSVSVLWSNSLKVTTLLPQLHFSKFVCFPVTSYFLQSEQVVYSNQTLDCWLYYCICT